VPVCFWRARCWRYEFGKTSRARFSAQASIVPARRRSPSKRGCVLLFLFNISSNECGEMLHLGGHEDQRKDGSHAADGTTQQTSKCVVTCSVCFVQPHHLYDTSALLLLLCCLPGYPSLPSSPQQTNSTLNKHTHHHVSRHHRVSQYHRVSQRLPPTPTSSP
jgi:hypothetical protein